MRDKPPSRGLDVLVEIVIAYFVKRFSLQNLQVRGVVVWKESLRFIVGGVSLRGEIEKIGARKERALARHWTRLTSHQKQKRIHR